MKRYEFDVVVDKVPLDKTVENILKISGVIMCEVLSEANDANGWPTIRVTLDESKETLANLSEIFPDYEDSEI
jgi:hypothetical protein